MIRGHEQMPGGHDEDTESLLSVHLQVLLHGLYQSLLLLKNVYTDFKNRKQK